jgi:transcriptional regulator with XRE-family HTH domain
MVREEREKKGVTMRELADRLDRSHTVIAKIESGERRVDL